MDPLHSGDPAAVGGHRLLGRLGAGGMGTVFLARSPGGALSALKVISPEFAHDTDFRVRFRREAEAAGRVANPWVVPVTAADPEAPAPWLATRYVPGPSVEEAVREFGPLDEAAVRVLGARLAEALAAVHTAGLVHRDVKPGNVLLAPDGPRLIDFGIARATDETALTAAGSVIGTPGFLAPEQAEGAEARPAGDVFSLGCVLAYAATGRPPFGRGAAEALLFRTVHDEPALDGVPEDLRPVLDACLAKDPEARPAPAALPGLLAADARPGGDWLPEPLLRLIAERSAAALALPGVEDTLAQPPRDGARRPGRRALLAGGAAALVAAGGGAAAWALTRGGSPAAGGGRRTLALHADLSGGAAAFGRAQHNGVRLAVERFNARAGRPFELALAVHDDGGEPARAVEVAKRLAGDRSVVAVVGPTTDEAAAAALSVYDKALLPVVTVSAGSIEVTQDGNNRSVFQARPAEARVAVAVQAALVAAGGRRPALVQDRAADTYGWQVAQMVNATLRSGGRVPRVKVTRAAATDFGPPVAELLGEDVDSLVFAGYYDRAALLAHALEERGFTGPRFAGQALVDTRFPGRAGAAGEGWVGMATFVDAAAFPAAKDFTAAHRDRFGSAPGWYAVEAYDAAGMVAAGMRALGRAAGDRQALLKRLRGTAYQGVTRTFRFDAKDGTFTGTGAAFRYEVNGGRFRFAGAAGYGAAA
ncbi:bifunctional serine/threonine-protein kinase/ABC transporter substrate-binding protein [Streptomyces sp. NPDC050560]|uniref:bifunctional serine/threonine-protein kinase/ABC transporter substrate-binding protein n=1 Tax=Streptomyces sp. NPDC050560 TaxID=3365630 RepID=UPI0037B685AA